MSSSSNKCTMRYSRLTLTTLLLTVAVAVGQLAAPSARADEPDGRPTASALGKQVGGTRLASLQITGNQGVARETLLKAAAEELDNFRTTGLMTADADDAAYQMELAYRKLGYLFATVDYAIDRAAVQGPHLAFTVKEGPRVRVAEIVLAGNEQVPTVTLQGFFAGPAEETPASEEWFVESRIAAAVDSIRTYYQLNGYLQSVVGDPQFTFTGERTAVTVQVNITEGTPFVVRELLFTGDLLPEITGKLAGIRESLVGKPYQPRRSAFLAESRITGLYGDLGYPDVRVEVERINTPRDNGQPESPSGLMSGEVVLEARIASGVQVTIASIRLTGHVKTSEEFILSRLTMKEGDVYRSAGERTSFSALYRTGLFSLVRTSLVETDLPERRILQVEMEELPGREVSFELGWGSYEQLRGKLELRSKNFTGKGRILSASAGASLKSTDLSLGFSDPWLLGLDLVFDLPFYYRTRTEPSFTRAETGMSTVISKRFTKPRVGISLAYTRRRTQQSDVSVEVDNAGNDYNFAAIKVQATRDTRNDLFFPSTGYRSLVAVEFTDPALGSSLAFVRFNTTNRFFFDLTPRTVLALRYDTGFVVQTSEDLTLPLAERFFNGGESTVRSFGESDLGPRDPETGDPLGGSAYNVGSVELRHRFRHNFGASLFLDYGNISPSGEGDLDRFATRNDSISATFGDYFSGFRPAIGVGLQYLLPVGPLRIDAAFNPSADKDRGENDFTVHFTVGMAF